MEAWNLSVQARMLWAKTGAAEQSNLWEPLYVHMLDSAGVAGRIWSDWLSDSVKSYLISEFDLYANEVAVLVSFIAGIHDIGKATPNFQAKVPERAEVVSEAGFDIPAGAQSQSHAYMGHLIVSNWLSGLGWDEDVYLGYAGIVAGHHGKNPPTDVIEPNRGISAEQLLHPRNVLGDACWASVQHELLSFIAHETGFDGIAERAQNHPIPAAAQVLLTGLTIMADWIASNTVYFPLVDEVPDMAVERERVGAGWRKLSIPNAEHFAETDDSINDLFRRRFPFLPMGACPRPVQQSSADAAEKAQSPCLLIIEADTGSGKTEASLLAAEILSAKFGQGGLSYLLPTQATSNAMYSRVESWLENVHRENGADRQQDIHLLHGKAALNDDWKRRASWGDSWMGDAPSRIHGKESAQSFDDAIIAHQWFNGRKRGLLAPFVVGTVDQLLFMALKAKHVHLRHLGLAGKVVVIDEVHAYDAYMNVYLDRALAFLGTYHVPVILLSATLPPARRRELMAAYQGHDGLASTADTSACNQTFGRAGHRRRRKRKAAAFPQAPRTIDGSPAYPLITCITADCCDNPYTCWADNGHGTEYLLEFMSDDDESLVALVRERLSEGGCICVLRNTVGRAQAAFRLLKKALREVPGIEFKLVHSRFVAEDRSRNDAQLLRLLGPNATERPRAMVVVGTQVIEQSLDIDFDMMITDVAPVDLLLQRMGRVHRHQRGTGQSERPPKLRQARCVITGIESWEHDSPRFEKGTESIYEKLILMRTVAALGEQHGLGQPCRVTTPDDTASLVEKVYETDSNLLMMPEEWQKEYDFAQVKAKRNRNRKVNAAHSWLLAKVPKGRVDLTDWMNGPISIDDEVQGRAAVRDGQESVEVTLVVSTDSGYELLPWVADELTVPKSLGDGTDIPEDEVARAAALCTVDLPPVLSIPKRAKRVVNILEIGAQRHFDGWRGSRWLRGSLPLELDEELRTELVLEDGEDGECEREVFEVSYSKEEGLFCERREDE